MVLSLKVFSYRYLQVPLQERRIGNGLHRDLSSIQRLDHNSMLFFYLTNHSASPLLLLEENQLISVSLLARLSLLVL